MDERVQVQGEHGGCGVQYRVKEEDRIAPNMTAAKRAHYRLRYDLSDQSRVKQSR